MIRNKSSTIFFTESKPTFQEFAEATFYRLSSQAVEVTDNAPILFLKLSYTQAALRQFSHVPYFELNVPPPLCWAYSEITARAQLSQVLAISSSDIGCARLRREMLNLDLAFIERSSYSLLQMQIGQRLCYQPKKDLNVNHFKREKVTSPKESRWSKADVKECIPHNVLLLYKVVKIFLRNSK